MNTAWMIFLCAAAAVVAVLFFFSFRKWPVVMAVSIAVSVCLAWELPYPPPLASVAGTSIYFLDILSVVALMLALGRMKELARNLGLARWAWLGLGLMLVLSLGRGLLQYSFGTTVNEFRPFLQLYAALSWAMSLPWSRSQTKTLIKTSAFATGSALVLVALYHVSIYGLGTTSDFVDAGTGIEQTTRPLVSGQALLLLLSGMVMFWVWVQEKRIYLISTALLFFGVVVLSQQRTVWAVGIACLIAVFIVGRAGTKVTMALVALTCSWLVAGASVANLAPQVSVALESAASNAGTYEARIRSWNALIDQSVMEGLTSVVFGRPMGSGFGRFEGVGRWVEFAPHNWYVTIFLRVGFLGLAFFLVFLLIVLYRILLRRQSMISLAIVTALIVYGWSYSWPWYICVLMGWAIVDGRPEVTGTLAGSRRSAPRGELPSRAQNNETGMQV